jgi:RNA polymerase sigma-70 factor (ECF subfamily)
MHTSAAKKPHTRAAYAILPAVSSEDESEVGQSVHLLRLAQQGNEQALNDLMARYTPRLRRWATGRLPRGARDIADTQDLVQDCLLQTFKRIEAIDADRVGGLQAYLRQAVMNRIRDELRRARRRPAPSTLDSGHPDEAPSPLEASIGRQAVDRYERALATLSTGDRDLVVARLELGFDYQELADQAGKPSANSARVAVQRALVKLAEVMHRER